MSSDARFQSLQIAVLTVSDTRTVANDTSGDYLSEQLQQAGHRLIARNLIPDDIEEEGHYAVQNFIYNEIGERVVDL